MRLHSNGVCQVKKKNETLEKKMQAASVETFYFSFEHLCTDKKGRGQPGTVSITSLRLDGQALFNAEEAGRYLETYKSYEQKPADVLKEKVDQDFMSKMTDVLTTVKSVNKTDCTTLLSTFGSLADLTNATREDLSLCPGLGPQKAKRLFDVLHESFQKTKN